MFKRLLSYFAGVALIFSLFGVLVFAVGWHTASQINAGSFQSGDYSFNGSLVLADNSSAVSAGAVRYYNNQLLGYDGTLWQNLTQAQIGSGLESGSLVFYNDTSCPVGFTEVVQARGRYLVGLNSGGTLESTVGTALSNSEDREVGQHNHGDSLSASSGGSHSHSGYSSGSSSTCGTGSYGDSSQSTGSGGSHGHSMSGSISNEGTTDSTNAPYGQYIVCIKD